MTTARDLLIVALDTTSDRPPERGDLSLALAGAEVIDLLAAHAVRLEDDRMVPGEERAPADRLLHEAETSLLRLAPYETVGDWLWRRGLNLYEAYLAALEKEGQLSRQRHGRMPFRAAQLEVVDSPARREATDRWASDEPVLAALGVAVGIREEPAEDAPGLPDDAAETVLAAVHDAVMELEAVRQRKAIEDAAFDNIWRGQ